MQQIMLTIASGPAHIELAWHAIAAFLNSPRVGWLGIAAVPYGIAMLVYPLTRKCPPAHVAPSEGDPR